MCTDSSGNDAYVALVEGGVYDGLLLFPLPR